MAGVTEEVSFYFYLILIDFHLNSHMWQLATMMDSANLDPSILCPDSSLASGRNHQPHWDLRPGEEGGRVCAGVPHRRHSRGISNNQQFAGRGLKVFRLKAYEVLGC